MTREEALKREISERLRHALERHGDRSIRSLERAMVDRGSDITSYGAIRSYVQGEKLPPLTFLMEAADELSVRPEWLLLGEGEMTHVEKELADDEEELLDALPELALWPKPARDTLLGMIVDYMMQAPDLLSLSGFHADVEISELESDLIFLATLPLRCWGFKGLGDLSAGERLQYLLGVLSALMAVQKDAKQGDPLSDYPDSLLPRLRGAVDELPVLTDSDKEREQRREAALRELLKEHEGTEEGEDQEE